MRHTVGVTDCLKGSHPTHVEPIAVDLAKHGFQVHDVAKNEDVAFNHAIQHTIHTCHSILAHSILAHLIVGLFPYARNRPTIQLCGFSLQCFFAHGSVAEASSGASIMGT